MNARRLTYPQAETATLEPLDLPPPKEGQLLVRTLHSAISRGTERLVYRGEVPLSEHERMRCPHQTGDFSFPVSYGYSVVGIVEETGPAVDGFAVGDRIFVLHPHQDRFVADQTFCHQLPDNIPAPRAVLAANMETALNAVWDAELPETSNISIIGAGVVGLLTAFLVKKFTATPPTVVDTNPAKRLLAEKLGLRFAAADTALAGQDRIFNTSASASGLQKAIDSAAFEASIIEISWYGDKPIELNLGGAFHSKRLRIISSQVGHVSHTRRDHTSHKMRMAEALEHLDDPALDSLVESAIAFDDLPGRLHDIFNETSGALCQLVTYTDPNA